MTTFEFTQVKEIADDLNAKLDQCENGEGNQCYTIDTTLNYCADRCCEFADAVRKWGREVFAGHVVFDSEAEQQWKTELLRLYNRAVKLVALGTQAETECFVLGGKQKLQAALWNLNQLIAGWITPKL